MPDTFVTGILEPILILYNGICVHMHCIYIWY